MLHIPILRLGQFYESVEKTELLHHATGQVVAQVSQANSGLIARDLGRMDDALLEQFSVAQLLEMSRKAAAIFMSADLPLGQDRQSFEDYIAALSATTGMPQAICRTNARKIHLTLDEMDKIVAGLTRGFDLSILDAGYGHDSGRMLSWFRTGRIFGAVLPSNSPGVHSLWIPAVALKTPIVLKPGREEPWTPYRVIEALCAAGFPRQAFGFYPTDHAGAGVLLERVSRAMLFGDAATTQAWAGEERIEIHGPGYSKIILGDDAAGQWEKYLDLMASSIAANGGRSCINASAIWTPRNADAIADALGKKLAAVRALPADDPDAQIAAFANVQTAQRINDMIDSLMDNAVDLTQKHRGSGRLVQSGRCAYLLPTILRCGPDHPLANREFLFPYASVIQCPAAEIARAIGPTLVATVITGDGKFLRELSSSGDINRLNIGPIPTWQLSWDQPHEGNLFELLYRQRAFQIEGVA